MAERAAAAERRYALEERSISSLQDINACLLEVYHVLFKHGP